MKTLSIFCAVFMPVVSMAQNVDGEFSLDNLNLGWSTSYDVETHRTTFDTSWSGRGWNYVDESGNGNPADFSQYDRLVVELTDVIGETERFTLAVEYSGTEAVSSNSGIVVKGSLTLRVDLDDLHKSHVRNVFVMCDKPGSMTIKRAYLAKRIEYGDPKILEMSDMGVISGNQFEGYSEDARVDFVFKTEGELMGNNENGEYVSMKGWGVGVVCSVADPLGAEVPLRDILLFDVGEQTYSCLLSDLRYLLSVKDDDGEYGIFWTVWPLGNITDAHVVKTQISDVKK